MENEEKKEPNHGEGFIHLKNVNNYCSEGSFHLGITPPKYVGAYRIGGPMGMSISFSLENKPNFINRWFCKWCLGWEWVS